ncbi:hypothetical protein NIES4103_34950 [Nostoc sp. NIES-4103]|nr:hypothetical protein NIES4103_34950 [Nostoc sp. NIES-4103]
MHKKINLEVAQLTQFKLSNQWGMQLILLPVIDYSREYSLNIFSHFS